MNTVSMQVNAANLVKGLKFSFTNKTTFLGELMQNARRANATQVVFEFAPETKILRVTDDGCGIDSIETLLTVAESGWDADVVAQEHPFGIGFLSALFACRHLTVVSKGGRFSVNTDDVLSFKPVTVSPVADWDGITVITMLGVDLDLKNVQDTLNRLSRGFPIPVSLNDVFLERPYALDSGLRFRDTEIGAVYLNGVDKPQGSCSDFIVYLQGLPIYRSSTYLEHDLHVIHLDSSRFYARLPDRDKLIDEADVVNFIKSILTKEIEKSLVLLKAEIPAEEFVLFFDIMRKWQLKSLLNDVPVVPVQALHEFDDYPNCDEDAYGTFVSNIAKPMIRSEVEAREVVEIDEDISSQGAAHHMFARERNALIYQNDLDNGHWIHSMIRCLKDEETTIELVNESHRAYFEGEWVFSVPVRFCDAYRIKIGNDVVEITDDALYQGEENNGDVILPKTDASGFVLKQISSYRSEYEDFQESTHETDMYAFESFVVANTSIDAADAMKRLLPGFSGCPSLYGKSFVITLDDSGKVASVTAA